MTLEKARELAARYPWFKAPRIVICNDTAAQDSSLDLYRLFFPVGAPAQVGVCGKDFSGYRTVMAIDDFLGRKELHIVSPQEIPQGDISEVVRDPDPDMVSEELAEIYLDQGHKSMAVEIYRKLILLYPEKSIYFARLIEKAENRQ